MAILQARSRGHLSSAVWPPNITAETARCHAQVLPGVLSRVMPLVLELVHNIRSSVFAEVLSWVSKHRGRPIDGRRDEHGPSITTHIRLTRPLEVKASRSQSYPVF